MKTKYEVKDATYRDLEELYKKEAYCFEGIVDDEETYQTLADAIHDWDESVEVAKIYRCKGGFMNYMYALSGDNAYQDDLTFMFIDWQEFGNDFSAAEHKGNCRYFSDVVDNNARREIRKHNERYRSYHSLYGDEWFYQSMLDMNPELYDDWWFQMLVNKIIPDFDWKGHSTEIDIYNEEVQDWALGILDSMMDQIKMNLSEDVTSDASIAVSETQFIARNQLKKLFAEAVKKQKGKE